MSFVSTSQNHQMGPEYREDPRSSIYTTHPTRHTEVPTVKGFSHDLRGNGLHSEPNRRCGVGFTISFTTPERHPLRRHSCSMEMSPWPKPNLIWADQTYPDRVSSHVTTPQEHGRIWDPTPTLSPVDCRVFVDEIVVHTDKLRKEYWPDWSHHFTVERNYFTKKQKSYGVILGKSLCWLSVYSVTTSWRFIVRIGPPQTNFPFLWLKTTTRVSSWSPVVRTFINPADNMVPIP